MKTISHYIFTLYFVLFTSTSAICQVGVNTTDPTTMLDINGALSLRAGTSLSLTNNNNTNVTLGTTPYSYYQINGPTSNFNVNSIVPETDSNGQLVILENNTNHSMTLRHRNGGLGANQINCPGERDITLSGRYASATLLYNELDSKWSVINYTDNRYGDNIQSVKGTSDISVNTTTFTDMADMSITFTPNHTTVYVSFSASGIMDDTIIPEASLAHFNLINVTAGNIRECGVETLTTDYDFDDVFGEIGAVSWNAHITMFPVTVTPGTPTTLKIQWQRQGVFPTTLLNPVNSHPEGAHRSLTIFD